MRDVPIAHVADMQQAVDAAQVDKSAIVGQVLDDAGDRAAFLKLASASDFAPAGLLQQHAPRDNRIAPPPVQLKNAYFEFLARDRRPGCASDGFQSASWAGRQRCRYRPPGRL